MHNSPIWTDDMLAGSAPLATLELARSRDGMMIHERTCRYARSDLPWIWAEGKGLHEVIHVMERFGYETCLAYKPLPGTIIRRVTK